MSYNDGWRVYENIPVNIEKLNILTMSRVIIQNQLFKQTEKANRVSQEVMKATQGNITKARRIKATMRLQGECEARDNLDRRLTIINEWIDNMVEVVANE